MIEQRVLVVDSGCLTCRGRNRHILYRLNLPRMSGSDCDPAGLWNADSPGFPFQAWAAAGCGTAGFSSTRFSKARPVLLAGSFR